MKSKTTKLIRADKLFADYSYQRDLKDYVLKGIIDNYSDDKADVVRVSERPNGMYAILDGNHTVTATRAVKGENAFVECSIYTGLTIQEEAELFTVFNTERRNTTFNENFKARLRARDKDAIAYEMILKEAHIPYVLSGGKKGYLRSHGTPYKLFMEYGKAHIQAVLALIEECFNGEKDRWHISLIKGVSTFLNVYQGEIDIDSLKKKLSETTVNKYRSLRAGFDVATVGGGNIKDIPGARALVEIYNFKRRVNKLDFNKLYV